MEKIEIHSRLTTIAPHTFSGCKKVKHIRLYETAEKIGWRSLAYNDSLEEICLPNGLKEIGPEVFLNCHGLEKVFVPSTVQIIGNDAFVICRSIREPTAYCCIQAEKGSYAIEYAKEYGIPYEEM